jgi:hypothetical protein
MMFGVSFKSFINDVTRADDDVINIDGVENIKFYCLVIFKLIYIISVLKGVVEAVNRLVLT